MNIGLKKVITYGTFDLFHFGHLEILRRAKKLGEFDDLKDICEVVYLERTDGISTTEVIESIHSRSK